MKRHTHTLVASFALTCLGLTVAACQQPPAAAPSTTIIEKEAPRDHDRPPVRDDDRDHPRPDDHRTDHTQDRP